MKGFYKALAIVLFAMLAQVATAQRGVWKRINDLGTNRINSPTPKTSPAVFTINGKAYVGGGYNGNLALSYDFWEYDPVADTWTQKAPFAGGKRFNMVSFTINGKGYVAAGSDSVIEVGAHDYNDLWEYDPIADTWTQKASLPALQRTTAIGFAIGNYGYLGLGITDSNLILHKDFWRYDPGTDSWMQMADFAGIARENAVAFSLLGKGYVTSGDSVRGVYLKDVWQYDPTGNNWSQKSDFTGPARLYATATAADSFAIFGTGHCLTTQYMIDLWKYNPVNDSWAQISNAGNYGRVFAVSFTLNNTPYLTMGNDSSSGLMGHQNEELWQYNTGTNTWVQKTNSGIGTITGAQSFSMGNNGYINGGNTLGGYFYNRFWQYNTATGAWAAKPACPEDATYQHLAFTALGNGYALFTRLTGDSVARLWQYNPGSNAWSQKAPFTPSIGLPYAPVNFDSTVWMPAGNAYNTSIYNVAADSWSTTQTEIFWNDASCSFTIGNKAYQGCGSTTVSGNFTCLGSFNSYESDFQGFANLPSVPPREFCVAFAINGKGYIGLGQDCNNNYLADMYEFDPVANTITRVADFPGGPRESAAAFVIGDRGYVGSGNYRGNVTKDFWSFNPNSCFADTQQLCIVGTDTALQSPVVVWQKANKYATDSFYIYRANTPDTAYAQVAAIGRDSLSQWEDTSAHADQHSYRYKISVKDTCGFINDLSPYHQTLYLYSAGAGQFSWTPYAIENSTVPAGTYYLYRDSIGNGNWQVLQTLADTQTHAVDTAYASYQHARYMLVIELSNPCNPTRGYTIITSNIISGVIIGTGLVATESNKVKVMPNPAHNQVTISAVGLKEICVYDVLGQVIYNSVLNKDIITIPVTQWQSGIYFYQIKTDSGWLSGKLVKE